MWKYYFLRVLSQKEGHMEPGVRLLWQRVDGERQYLQLYVELSLDICRDGLLLSEKLEHSLVERLCWTYRNKWNSLDR